MNNYQLKINKLAKIIQEPIITYQVKEINMACKIINNRQVLNKSLTPLGLKPDELDQLERKLPDEKKKDLYAINNLLNNFRSFLSRYFGIWSLPNQKSADLLASQFQVHTGLEIMAGNGYWSKALANSSVKMIATDSLTWAKSSKTGQENFYQIEKLDALSAIEKYKNVDMIICSWAPNFGDIDYQVLKQYRKYCNQEATKLFFIGEKYGATNTDKFWQEAHQLNNAKLKRINHSFESFDFINEEIYEIE